MNPLTQLTPQNLSKLINVSYAKHDHLRKARAKFIAQYVGRFYAKSKPSDLEERKASPINLIYQAVSTLVPNLVFRDPKYKVRTDILAYRGYADMLELALNKLVGSIRLSHEMRMIIVDSLFYAGFCKTGIATSGECITIAGQEVALGEPFACRVDPDDMILDPMARQWDEQMIIGNRFRVLRQDLLDTGLYDPDEIMALGSRTDHKVTFEAQYLSGDKSGEVKEVMDFVDLAEIYIPRDQRVVTIPWTRDSSYDKFLRDVDWSGPETGPYHMLGYSFVPDNLLPLPPVSLWYDLHVLGNRIARKISRQADRLKRVLAYEGSAIEDAEAIADGDDGEAIRVNNLGAIKEVNFGGTTEDAYGFMQWVETKFSDVTNNLEMLSGQKADAPTATQSEMLQNNSSVRIADLQNQVYNFCGEIGTNLAFFLHTDPLIELPLIRRMQGQDTQVHYTPEMRQGDFVNYMLSVQPMSMARPDPNMKVQHLLQFATGVIPAAAQAASILGPAFKVQAFLERMAREIGLEEFEEIIDMPTFNSWMLTQLASKLNPGKAGPFATMPGNNALPADLAMQQQLQALAQQAQMAQQQGQPGQPMQGMASGGPAPGFNQNQPNPSQMSASPQNIGPNTEQNQAQQATAGALQRAYPSTSVRARAMAMS